MHRPTSVHLAYVSSLYATLSVEKPEQHEEPAAKKNLVIAKECRSPLPCIGPRCRIVLENGDVNMNKITVCVRYLLSGVQTGLHACAIQTRVYSIDAPPSYVAASSQWSSYYTVAGFRIGRVIVAPQRRIDVCFIAIARFT